MFKASFQNDYSEGAHPRILAAIAHDNLSQEPGYGEDRFCLEAARIIRSEIGSEDADVHFLSGGTQANLILLSSILKPFESVIAVDSGHICVHETGAIEATGHKINSITGRDGKVTAAEIEAVVKEHYFEHMVRPKVVYLSHSTELGTIYSAREIQEISDTCKRLRLYLYVDGARLGSALVSSKSDLGIKQLSKLVDAFYIGGTKNGILLGECLVILHPDIKPDFRYNMKQKGGLLAKGRILGIQFLELFRDGLYYELAGHANDMADMLSDGLKDLGYEFLYPPCTNQIFPILPDMLISRLESDYLFYVWKNLDHDRSAIRLVTSWATTEEMVKGFLEDVGRG